MPDLKPDTWAYAGGMKRHYILKRRVGSKNRFDIYAMAPSEDVGVRTVELLMKGTKAELAEPEERPTIPMPRLGSPALVSKKVK